MSRWVLFCVALGWAASTQPAGATEPYTFVRSEESLNYLLRLPAGYGGGRDRYPFLLFLHGIAQKGNGSARAIGRVAEDGPFRAMRDGRWDGELPLIVVGPQSGGLQPWWRGKEVLRILAHAERTYRIDPRRVYLSGISMGGRSLWWLVRRMPGRFAAVLPASAWSADLRTACSELTPIGVWAFHGARDRLISPRAGRKPVAALNACEPPPPVPARLTVLRGVGHGSWELVFGNLHGDRNLGADGREYTDIYRWLLSFTRS